MTAAVGQSLIKAARRLRSSGRLDDAVRLLAAEGDLDDPSVDAHYLQWLMELEWAGELHEALDRSIARVCDRRAGQAANHLRLVLHLAEDTCLPAASIQRLLTLPLGELDAELKPAWEAARLRQRFRHRLQRMPGHASLLSLGLNCMPWSLPNLWGLRSKAQFETLATPFSLGVHKFKGVHRAISSDFREYFELPALRTVETENGHHVALRTDLTAMWNHQRGEYWLKDDFAALRADLGLKVENFRTACRAEDAVFLLGKSPRRYPQDELDFLEPLNQALQPFTGRAQNRVIIFDEAAEAFGRHIVDGCTVVINCPYPESGYVWSDMDARDTPLGLSFETACSRSILRSLVEWGLLSRTAEGAAETALEATG